MGSEPIKVREGIAIKKGGGKVLENLYSRGRTGKLTQKGKKKKSWSVKKTADKRKKRKVMFTRKKRSMLLLRQMRRLFGPSLEGRGHVNFSAKEK